MNHQSQSDADRSRSQKISNFTDRNSQHSSFSFSKPSNPWDRDLDESIGTTLTENLECDVCIVGAGIGGLTTAYLLQKEGRHVMVVDAAEVGTGQTGCTTAQLSTALADRYFDLERYHGEQGAKLAAQSHRAAIDVAREIIEREKIDCDCEFLDGYLFKAPGADQDILQKERDACHRAGMQDVYILHKPQSDPMLSGENEVLCFPQQLQLNPILYLNGLARAFERMGGQIFTNSPVQEVIGGTHAHIKTRDSKRIDAGSIVVATNSPINDIFAIHTKQAPYRSYVIGVKIEKSAIPRALYWDTLDAYHYVRMIADDVLIVGGEDHKTGQDDSPEDRYHKLESWIRERLPAAGEVVYRWSGQVMETTDGLAFLGHNPLDRSNVYVITGDSGNGMTHGTIGALLIADQIHGRNNQWEKLYSPSRKSIRTGIEFLKENANVAAQYIDWFTPKEVTDPSQIEPGQGAIIRHGLSLEAVYKDENGTISKCSAVCPHLAGVVRWNSAEKSWDCPCHGSRFDVQGKVIEGPAVADLAKV